MTQSKEQKAAAAARKAARLKRRRDAVELRMAGVDYQTIADRVGYSSKGRAFTDIWDSMAKGRLAEEAELAELTYLELLRIDRLQVAHWPKALKGDAQATLIVLKLLERRARIIKGMEEPVDMALLVELVEALTGGGSRAAAAPGPESGGDDGESAAEAP
jgi:hypothetical protein